MVGEIILCVKEANKKTRGSAYQLLVEIGHAFHAAQPPALTISDVNVAGGLSESFSPFTSEANLHCCGSVCK